MSQTVHPTDFNMRSPHYRTLISAGARFESCMNASCVMDYGNSKNQEVAQAMQLGLADLTPLPRTGFKGPETVQWAGSAGLKIGQHNNRAYLQEDGLLAARLSDSEILVLNGLGSRLDQCARLEEKHKHRRPAGCYTVPRASASAWLMLTGQYSTDALAKLCGVDLRVKNFSGGAIAQTSVARTNCIVIRNNMGEIPAFHLLFDCSSTEYMWSCLVDAGMEFKGAPVGYASLLELHC